VNVEGKEAGGATIDNSIDFLSTLGSPENNGISRLQIDLLSK
jgi:hypothetical protein